MIVWFDNNIINKQSSLSRCRCIFPVCNEVGFLIRVLQMKYQYRFYHEMQVELNRGIISINISTNFVFYHNIKLEWLAAFKTNKEIRREMAKFVRLNGIVPASLIDADDTTTRHICLRSKIQDSLTRQLHKHQFDQKIIQGYSRINQYTI